MSGLPGKMTVDVLRSLVKNYELAGSGDIKHEVFKVERQVAVFFSLLNDEMTYRGRIGQSFSLFSRFLLRLGSVSEAYRLVRRVHMTYFQPDKYEKRYLIKARVVH
jgi:hypothetical protein